MEKLSLRILGFIGASIFATFFLFTLYIPNWVETFAYDFIESEISQKMDIAIDKIQPPEGNNALSRFAGTLFAQNEKRIEELRELLRNQAHQTMADSLAEIRNLDCDCRAKYAEAFENGLNFELSILQEANDQLVEFTQSKYMEITIELKGDIRIFTGANSIIFILLIAISFLKPKAIVHLFLPAALLSISTIWCSYFYIFEQNWLLTIIYSSYVGFFYLLYLGAVFVFLCDIVLNKGRASSLIMNTVGNAVGSSISVSPC